MHYGRTWTVRVRSLPPDERQARDRDEHGDWRARGWSPTARCYAFVGEAAALGQERRAVDPGYNRPTNSRVSGDMCPIRTSRPMTRKVFDARRRWSRRSTENALVSASSGCE